MTFFRQQGKITFALDKKSYALSFASLSPEIHEVEPIKLYPSYSWSAPLFEMKSLMLLSEDNHV